nr:hypothetical protein [uncultured Rhodopila sp.]
MIEGGAPDDITIRDDYFSPPEGYREGGGVSYADTTIPAAATPTVQWNHPLGEVVTILVQTGLRIDSLRELGGDVLPQWDRMQPAEDRMYRMPPDKPSISLMYVLCTHREAWSSTA